MARGRFVKTNVPGFTKDTRTGAILNTNKQALAEHQFKRDTFLRLTALENMVGRLEQENEELRLRITVLEELV